MLRAVTALYLDVYRYPDAAYSLTSSLSPLLLWPVWGFFFPSPRAVDEVSIWFVSTWVNLGFISNIWRQAAMFENTGFIVNYPLGQHAHGSMNASQTPKASRSELQSPVLPFSCLRPPFWDDVGWNVWSSVCFSLTLTLCFVHSIWAAAVHLLRLVPLLNHCWCLW